MRMAPDGANLGTGLGADVMSDAVLLTHSPQTSTVQSSRVQDHALSTWHVVWVWALKVPGNSYATTFGYGILSTSGLSLSDSRLPVSELVRRKSE